MAVTPASLARTWSGGYCSPSLMLRLIYDVAKQYATLLHMSLMRCRRTLAGYRCAAPLRCSGQALEHGKFRGSSSAIEIRATASVELVYCTKLKHRIMTSHELRHGAMFEVQSAMVCI